MSVIVFYNSSHSHTYICYVLHIKIYLHISEVLFAFSFSVLETHTSQEISFIANLAEIFFICS